MLFPSAYRLKIFGPNTRIGNGFIKILIRSDKNMMTISRKYSLESLKIIKCPTNIGQPKNGVELGPDAILEYASGKSKLVALIKEDTRFRDIELCTLFPSNPIEDPGFFQSTRKLVEKYPNIKNLPAFLQQKNIIEQECYKAAKERKFVLLLGGDHSVAAGSVSGINKYYPELCILWVDAHADINFLSTSVSGNLHGCPVSFFLDLKHFDVGVDADDEVMKCKIKPNRIGYVGLRSLDAFEKKILSQLNISSKATASSTDIARNGILASLQTVLNAIDPSHTLPIHLSFDIDALDPLEAPATGTPVRGGLLLREGIVICEELYKTGRLVSMDLVEVNPLLATSSIEEKKTITSAQSLILSSLGATHYGLQ